MTEVLISEMISSIPKISENEMSGIFEANSFKLEGFTMVNALMK